MQMRVVKWGWGQEPSVRPCILPVNADKKKPIQLHNSDAWASFTLADDTESSLPTTNTTAGVILLRPPHPHTHGPAGSGFDDIAPVPQCAELSPSWLARELIQ